VVVSGTKQKQQAENESTSEGFLSIEHSKAGTERNANGARFPEPHSTLTSGVMNEGLLALPVSNVKEPDVLNSTEVSTKINNAAFITVDNNVDNTTEVLPPALDRGLRTFSWRRALCLPLFRCGSEVCGAYL
jgi:hypothetical protein